MTPREVNNAGNLKELYNLFLQADKKKFSNNLVKTFSKKLKEFNVFDVSSLDEQVDFFSSLKDKNIDDVMDRLAEMYPNEEAEAEENVEMDDPNSVASQQENDDTSTILQTQALASTNLDEDVVEPATKKRKTKKKRSRPIEQENPESQEINNKGESMSSTPEKTLEPEDKLMYSLFTQDLTMAKSMTNEGLISDSAGETSKASGPAPTRGEVVAVA